MKNSKTAAVAAKQERALKLAKEPISMKALIKKGNQEKNETYIKSGFKLISVVIPSLNGNYAKVLLLTLEEHEKLTKASEKSKESIPVDTFALYADSNIQGEVLHTGMGSLTRTQFDEILKEKYNLRTATGRGGNQLKDVE